MVAIFSAETKSLAALIPKERNVLGAVSYTHLDVYKRQIMLCATALIPSLVWAKELPNIIYIVTDQQTASAMSCMGNDDLHTPNMDKLAQAGIPVSYTHLLHLNHQPLSRKILPRRAVCLFYTRDVYKKQGWGVPWHQGSQGRGHPI